MISDRLDATGRMFERWIDAAYARASGSPLSTAISGAALAVGVIVCGLGAFLLMLFVLVTFFA